MKKQTMSKVDFDIAFEQVQSVYTFLTKDTAKEVIHRLTANLNDTNGTFGEVTEITLNSYSTHSKESRMAYSSLMTLYVGIGKMRKNQFSSKSRRVKQVAQTVP